MDLLSSYKDDKDFYVLIFLSKLEIYVSNSISVQFVMPLWLQKSEILISQKVDRKVSNEPSVEQPPPFQKG